MAHLIMLMTVIYSRCSEISDDDLITNSLPSLSLKTGQNLLAKLRTTV